MTEPRPDPGDHYKRGGCPYNDLCAGCRAAMDRESRTLAIALYGSLAFVWVCVVAMVLVGMVPL